MPMHSVRILRADIEEQAWMGTPRLPLQSSSGGQRAGQVRAGRVAHRKGVDGDDSALQMRCWRSI